MTVRIRKGHALGLLNITPLIDVVFLLLIFFLVATRFAREDREMEFPLPDASEAQPLIAQPRDLFINVDQDGDYFVDGQKLTASELAEVLVRSARNNPLSQSVKIRAHKDVAFDRVVRAMNLCKQAGIHDYMANVQQE